MYFNKNYFLIWKSLLGNFKKLWKTVRWNLRSGVCAWSRIFFTSYSSGSQQKPDSEYRAGFYVKWQMLMTTAKRFSRGVAIETGTPIDNTRKGSDPLCSSDRLYSCYLDFTKRFLGLYSIKIIIDYHKLPIPSTLTELQYKPTNIWNTWKSDWENWFYWVRT